MPMNSASYEKYYLKNREALIEKMRGRYDPEKKKAYYEEHKEEMKTAMAKRYKENKAQRNLTALNSILANNPPEAVKDKVNDLIKTEEYKTANLRLIHFLQRQSNAVAEKSAD